MSDVTLSQTVDDLDATMALVLDGVKGDTDSFVLVPLWQLAQLLDAVRPMLDGSRSDLDEPRHHVADR